MDLAQASSAKELRILSLYDLPCGSEVVAKREVMMTRHPFGPARLRALGVCVLLFGVMGFAACDHGPAPAAADEESATLEPSSGKRALIVAIGKYEPSTKWSDLSSANDVALIRDALKLQGFADSDIHEIRNQDATRKDIIAAVRKHLIEPAKKGDVLVLHYSGHGQQVTDDENRPDELDGYDETLVPYDAPKKLRDGYRGEKHLRDDVLNDLMQEARVKVGPTGNVVMFLDSCYSGSGTRGTSAVRGADPLGLPREGAQEGAESGAGFYEGKGAARGAGEAATLNLAPYFVLSAARHNQVAYETTADDGTPVGSLSYAVSKALTGMASGSSYRNLRDDVVWLMEKKNVPNKLQAEGDVDSEVFSGRAIAQSPYFEVKSVSSGGDVVTVKAGSLVGLLKGSGVAFHRTGTLTPTDESLLAHGEVAVCDNLVATVRLEQAGNVEELERSRAFVTYYSFGSLKINVALDNLSSDLESKLRNELRSISAVTHDTSVPVVRVRRDDGGQNLVVELVETGQVILGPLSINAAELEGQIGNRLLDFARNRYMRGMKLSAADYSIALDMIPLQVKDCLGEQVSYTTCKITELDPAAKLNEGGELVWKVGDYFKLRVHNTGARAAYVSILDLVSDGTIVALWPPEGVQEKSSIKAGGSWDPPPIYEVSEPIGSEVLMAMATENWVDFHPITTPKSARTRGASKRGAPKEFEELFTDMSRISRAAIVGFRPGAVSTAAVTITVNP
jgi:hypothetical protein